MGQPPDDNRSCSREDAPGGATGPLVLVLCTADADLRRAWEAADPPLGFRLTVAAALRPEDLASQDFTLMLVDAERVRAADEPLAEAIRSHAARCVWTGAAEAIDHLGPALVGAAYDVLVTPTSATVLDRRLATWSRNIQRTAALDALGRRVEELAEASGSLAARLAG
ncbi:MAG: hypothetical protein IMZ66_11485, partial [Planctomycetes bacterium]|nr:hypothetical protein [Planctomycetota bacterium]